MCTTDAQTLLIAESFLSQYGTDGAPPLNVRNIGMQPIVEGDNDGWQLVKTSVGDAAVLRLRPEGSTATLEFEGVVSGIGWQITPNSSRLSVQLEDGVQTVSFILDSATFGVLDQNRLGY